MKVPFRDVANIVMFNLINLEWWMDLVLYLA